MVSHNLFINNGEIKRPWTIKIADDALGRVENAFLFVNFPKLHFQVRINVIPIITKINIGLQWLEECAYGTDLLT